MAYHIVHSLKRFAVSAAIRCLPARAGFEMAPEPRTRSGDDLFGRDDQDDWMFDGPSSIISPAVDALAGELSRVSSALGELRSLLSTIMTHAPIPEVQVSAALPNFDWAEDVLFDGSVSGSAVTVSGSSYDDAFLFDEDAVVPANWTPLRPALAEVALSA
ncbi:MAG: hypothetical protein AAF216_12745 [Pseudomonadota bacterium]